MIGSVSIPSLPYCPASLAERLLAGGQRVLLYGETGIGKSALTAELASELSGRGVNSFAISSDPGSPCFGLPGTVSLGQYRNSGWHILAFEALCTLDVPEAWAGRQCAFLDAGRTVSLGEIVVLRERELRVRLPAPAVTARTLLMRDAHSEKNGLFVTAAPFGSRNLQFLPPPDAMPYPTPDYDGGPRPAARLRGLYATLINGVFGDPLLHLRLQQQQRSLLFDLGESGRLPTRIAHQVSDVFISHAHIDHIGGFLWLLRSRFGDFPSCRIFGPPGLIGHIKGMVDGILWDRIGEIGPRFEVAEIHRDRLRRARIQAGNSDCAELPEVAVSNGLIVDETLFSVRTATLDHGTPVQAYAFESKAKFNVDKHALLSWGLESGPWLNELKRLIDAGDNEAMIRLPDNSQRRVSKLAELFLVETPGGKLVYATDLADTAANREALSMLAHKADFFSARHPSLSPMPNRRAEPGI